MYGVTESEKYHLLSPVDLMHGMSEGQRDAVLKEHAKVRRLVTTRHSISFCLIFLGPFGIPSLPWIVIYRGRRDRCTREGVSDRNICCARY